LCQTQHWQQQHPSQQQKKKKPCSLRLVFIFVCLCVRVEEERKRVRVRVHMCACCWVLCHAAWSDSLGVLPPLWSHSSHSSHISHFSSNNNTTETIINFILRFYPNWVAGRKIDNNADANKTSMRRGSSLTNEREREWERANLIKRRRARAAIRPLEFTMQTVYKKKTHTHTHEKIEHEIQKYKACY